MMTTEQAVFKLASFLLSYPNEQVWNNLEEAAVWAEQVDSPHISKELQQGISLMQNMGREEIEQCYVKNFDFSEATSLYLTAHEYGDNRARGDALINLRILLASEGYEQNGGELPDFLPLLFEFMADCGNEEKTNLLKPRLAKVIAKIRDHLDSESPYAPIVAAVAAVLPAPQDQHFPDWEEADTGEMPYPLQFG